MSKRDMDDFRRRIAKNDGYARKRIYAPKMWTVNSLVNGVDQTDEVYGRDHVEAALAAKDKHAWKPGTVFEVKDGGVKRLPQKQAVACILVGYCDDTLAYYNAIFDEAKKTFPNLDPEDVTCAKVQRSSSVKSFTMILFTCPNEKQEGWDYYESQIDFGY